MKHSLLLSILVLSLTTASWAETETDEEESDLLPAAESGLEVLPQPMPPKKEEAWKGTPSEHIWELTAFTGLEFLDGAVGVPLKIAVARQINYEGWLEDINDALFIEAFMGPLLINSAAAFTYSVHLKWNFLHSPNQGLYATLGLGGLFTGTNLGNRDRIYPRLAIGGFVPIGQSLWLRFEVSQEMIATGISLPF